MLCADDPGAAAVGDGLVKFRWKDNSGIAMSNATDKCIAVVYCPELKRSVYTTAGAERSNCEHTIHAWEFTGKTVETWIGFISAEGDHVATSIYTGLLLVS